jgi:hypothetical protein
MTDYNKQTYLAACEALFDGKPTEVFMDGQWIGWDIEEAPINISTAKEYQWRAVDPTREYREAFKAGKRVE